MAVYVISYHNHFVPAISYHSENHFRTITISYHMQIDTLLPFNTICRSKHYDHFVPYADRYIIVILLSSHFGNITTLNFSKKLLRTTNYHHTNSCLVPIYIFCIIIILSFTIRTTLDFSKKLLRTTNYHHTTSCLVPIYIFCINIISSNDVNVYATSKSSLSVKKGYFRSTDML
jgi:hypothetical protein